MELDLWVGVSDPKKAILKAALRVFAERGYAGATTREIAKEAGVANGLVFYHYIDKQTLFSELARHLRGVVARELRGRQKETGDFYEWIESFIEQKLFLYSRYPELYRFFMLQIRQFPEMFDENSREVRALYPLWPGDDGILAYEILESALNGMTTKLIEEFQAGGLSADDYMELGMKKAAEYIAFFKGLDHSHGN